MVVEHEDLATRRRHRPADHVPGRHDQVLALGQGRQSRDPTGRDDHDVRCQGQDIGDVGHRVEAELDARVPALRHEPVDDADEIREPGGRAGSEADLPARIRGRLEQDDAVAALGRDARGLQAGGPGSDDDDRSARTRARDRELRDGLLASGRDVVDAQAVESDVDPVEAVRRPDARPDPIGLPRLELPDDVRVGHVGPHHPDHVDQPLGDGIARGRDVRDPGRVEDRQVETLAEPSGQLEARSERRPETRDDVGQRLVGRDRALDDVDEVDHPGPGEGGRDRETVRLGQAARHVLRSAHPDADDELVADLPADGFEHLDREAHPVLERAAVPVRPRVDERRPELVDQVPVGLQLEAVEAALLAATGRRPKGPDDAPDVAFLHLLREAPMGGLADG